MKKILLLLILFVTVSNAQSWKAERVNPANRLNGVDFLMGFGVAVGDGGSAYIKNGYFSDWVLSRSGQQTDVLKSVSISLDQAIAVGNGGLALRYNFSTLSWSPFNLNTSHDLNAVYFSFAGNAGYIVGNSSTAFKTTNGGTSWSPVNFNLTDYQILSVHFNESNTVVMGTVAPSGTQSRVLISENGGLGFFPVTLPYVGSIFSVSVVEANTIYAAGEFGLLKSTNRGLSWLDITQNIPGYIYPASVAFFGDYGNIIFNSGMFARTTNGGASWTTETAAPVGTGIPLAMSTRDFNLVQAVGWGENQAWTRIHPIEVKIADGSVFPGDTVDVPVFIGDWAPDYHAFSSQFYIDGFAPKLKFLGIVTSEGSLLSTANWSHYTNQTNDNLRFISYGSAPITGSGTFCYLRFKATPPDPTVRDSVFVSFDSLYFNTKDHPVIGNGGWIRIKTRFPGDVDLNGVVQAFDASMVLRYLTGTVTLNEEQLGNAEVTNNNQITSADASTIAMYVAGLIPALPWGNFPQAAGTPVMNDLNSQYGQQVEVPVYINSRDDLYSLEGRLEYDASVFNYAGLQLNPAFANALKEVRNEDGTVKFAVAALNEVEFPTGEPVMKLLLNYTGLGHNNTSEVSLAMIRINENIHLFNAASSTIHIVTGIEDAGTLPGDFALMQNYPNPFNPATSVKFSIPERSFVTLEVYNASGQRVATLLQGEREAGYYNASFNATDLPSGLYFIKMTAGKFTGVVKAILLK